MLFYTGGSRFASEVARSVVQNLGQNVAQIRRLRAMVDEGFEILKNGSIVSFGELLHEGWMIKRGLSSEVTSSRIDDLYDRARAEGAVGGKLLGAGSTGCMLIFAAPDRHDAIRKALPDSCIHIPFKFDKTGCRVIDLNHM